MDWVNITAAADKSSLDSLEAWFWEHGAVSVTVEDGLDKPIYEPPPGEEPLWDEVLVTGLFEDELFDEQLTGKLQQAGFTLKMVAPLADRPWEREWLTRFKPMQFGTRLWICPTGYELDEADRVIVRLDPGLAFGTGTHETTRLCLEYLDGIDLHNSRVIDYGCGSGILAIAASLLGAKSVEGIDNDPQALYATRENAARNGVQIPAQLPGASLEPAEVVLANILAGPIVDLADLLLSLTRPGGLLILSGIMSAQASWVMDAYDGRATLIDRRDLNGWVRLVWRCP